MRSDRPSEPTEPPARSAKPPWIRVRAGHAPAVAGLRDRLRRLGLATVCEAAGCPNLGHCWSGGRATILLLGEGCTRSCTFCRVGRHAPRPPDPGEPGRVAAAVCAAGLREVTLTSVTRDDLPDGGAAHWAETIRQIHARAPGVPVEVLVPDFGGLPEALALVFAARPEVFGHNLETVPRLYPAVRPQADYARSLAVLRAARDAGLLVKTSLMLGLGETAGEIAGTLRDARDAGARICFLGQYLQPTPAHAPVARYLPPAEFDHLAELARAVGFECVASAPLVRSSYHEEEQAAFVRRWRRREERR
jgi:lipoic acid synthetase